MEDCPHLAENAIASVVRLCNFIVIIRSAPDFMSFTLSEVNAVYIKSARLSQDLLSYL